MTVSFMQSTIYCRREFVTTGFVLQGLWWVWRWHFSVSRKVLVTLSSVPMFHSPTLPVLLNSHLKLGFQLLMGLQVQSVHVLCSTNSSQYHVISTVETMDYGAIDVILMFDTCETRKCVNVTITEDLVDEPLEFFTYTLTGTPSLDPRIELNPIDGRVEIIDNDGEYSSMNKILWLNVFQLYPPVNITVGYNPISYVASEGQGSVELTIVIFDPPVGGAPCPFTLVINTQDGTASMHICFHPNKCI